MTLDEYNLRWLFSPERLQAPPDRRKAGSCQNEMGGEFMSRILFVVLIATGLIAAPLPALMQTAAAQTAPPAAPEQKQIKKKKAPTPGQPAARERLKKCAAE